MTDDIPDAIPSSDNILKKYVTKTWDPFANPSHLLNSRMSATGKVRIKRDIMQMFSEPITGIIICPDGKDFTLVYALITGLFDTPYEEYPSHPPHVKLLTTGLGKVRFNPNWYKNGKICISILGTWAGPGWTPAQTLSSVLVSIQSLMNSNPYHNEPGFEKERQLGDSDSYNKCIEHETIRAAVCEVLEGSSCVLPEQLMDLAKSLFVEYYDHYVTLCKERLHLDGKKFKDPFGWNEGEFQYQKLLERLEKLFTRFRKEDESGSKSEESGSSSLGSV